MYCIRAEVDVPSALDSAVGPMAGGIKLHLFVARAFVRVWSRFVIFGNRRAKHAVFRLWPHLFR